MLTYTFAGAQRFFSKHEVEAKHLLCCSDCEPVLMSDLLASAKPAVADMWDNLSLHYTETQGHPVRACPQLAWPQHDISWTNRKGSIIP
jgi:hypothetical protein